MKQHVHPKRDTGRRALRLVAGVGAISVLALTVTGGAGTRAPLPAGQGAPGVAAQSQDSTELDVHVGKSVEVTADASGEVQATGFFASTDVAGDGSETVAVPMGPNDPVNLSSVESLQVEGQSVIYDLSNQGDEVQNNLVGGGRFEDELPVDLDVVVEVDGEEVDPNTASSLTGDVRISYKFTNNTAEVETIPYVDANGNHREITTTVAVPFAIHIDVTYGAGWANISAPFANGGMSAGETLSGDTSLGVSASEDDPDGAMVLTARAEGAAMPAAAISITPHGTDGSPIYTKGDKVAKGGATLSDSLNGKAVPALLEVQSGLGKTATDLDQVLKEKVNPALRVVGELHVDPTDTNDKIQAAGDTVDDLITMLFAGNGALTDGGAKLGTALAQLVSEDTEAALDEISASLEDADETLATLIPALRRAGRAMQVVGPALGVTVDELLQLKSGDPDASLEGGIRDRLESAGLKPAQIALAMTTLDDLFIAAVGFSLRCEDPDQTCLGEASVAQILDQLALESPEEACRTGWDTKRAWTRPKYRNAMREAIDSPETDPDDRDILIELQTLLDEQRAALGGPKNELKCVAAAQQLDRALTGLLTGLTDIGDGVLDLVPVLRTIQRELRGVNRLLTQLERELPIVRESLTKPCPNPSINVDLADCGFIAAMDVVTDANQQAIDNLQGKDSTLVTGVQGVVSNLFGIVNLLGAAAPTLENTLAVLPKGIADIAYGPVGAFVGGLSDLGAMGAKMSENASKGVAVSVAVDEMFNDGAAFPYGPAEGETVTTEAVYQWKVAAPVKPTASTGARAGLAIVLLLIGAVAGGLLYRRAK